MIQFILKVIHNFFNKKSSIKKFIQLKNDHSPRPMYSTMQYSALGLQPILAASKCKGPMGLPSSYVRCGAFSRHMHI